MLPRKITILFFSSLLNVSAFAQTNTDLFLFTISSSEGKIKLLNPENISNILGYNNQPFFHPKKPLLF